MAKRQKQSMFINSIPNPEENHVIEEKEITDVTESPEIKIDKAEIAESTEFENVSDESDVILDLQNKLEESNARYIELMAERDALQEQVIDLTNTLNSTKNERETNEIIENLIKERNDLKEKVDDLTNKIAYMKNNNEIEESRLQFEILNLKSQLDELKKAKSIESKISTNPQTIPQPYYNPPPRKMSQLEKEGYESWN